MEKLATVILGGMCCGVLGACPSSFSRIESFHILTYDYDEPTPLSSYCSRVWPNETPEIALFPSPPGCLFFGISSPIGSDGQLPMKLPGNRLIHWIPESEIRGSLDSDPFDVTPARCESVLSKITTESRLIVVGENCVVPNSCTVHSPTSVYKSTATCAIEEEPTKLLEATGWHRTLGALLHGNFDHFAYQWLPRQFFAESDELDRKSWNKSHSVSIDVNIENPSLLSPPQLVKVNAFPFPAHARVNPPKRGETHFTVFIPKAIWAVLGDVSDCSIERVRLRDLIKLPDVMNIPDWDDMFLVRTKSVSGAGSYADTEIPSGNPEDLLETVAVTAVTATVGALAIIVASLSK